MPAATVTLARRTPSMKAKKVLRERELIGPYPVLRHEQPACAPLIDRVATVARHPLRGLLLQRLRVTQQQREQCAVRLPQAGQEPLGVDARRRPLVAASTGAS